MKNKILIVFILAYTSVWAGFEFGDCSGSGSFEQQIEQYQGDYENDVIVGDIPIGIQGLRVELISNRDVDIRLIAENNDKIVHWPHGILNKSYQQTKNYKNVPVTYSGYNGFDEQKGHEFIEVNGSTPTTMTIRAFGYRSGYATVNYSWTGKDNCSGASDGTGHFEQAVLYKDITLVGTIPPNIDNLEINLTSSNDIDIQLYGEDGTAIIKWPDGLLAGASVQNIEYHGMQIEWSGYNGVGGNKGHEYIKVSGLTTEILTMKVYGYQAGFADVDYSWGNGENNDTDTDIVAPIITLLGDSSVTLYQGATYTDAGATANDNKDGDITANIVIVNPVNTNNIGSYTVTYNVSDSAGNNAVQVTRTVNVIEVPDTTAPIITLLGDSSVTLYQGATYTDAGATANDNKDGDITANIVIVNPVNTNNIGSYTVTYNVSDSAGNNAVQVTRTVNVIEVPSIVTTYMPLLIVRIEFLDYTFTSNATTWHNKIYGNIEGQLNHYMNEISYGKFQFIPANETDDIEDDGIITVQLNENHPNTQGDASFLSRLNDAIALANAEIDFSVYDSNNDNAISLNELQIMYLVAGGESATGTNPGEWAHSWCMYGSNASAPTHDGVSLMNCYKNGNYSLFGEKHGTKDASIGIIAHELGHAVFQLPDLYDTNGGSEGIGNFGLMGAGSWGYKSGDTQSGQTPTHMTGWSKIQSGFVIPTVISENTTDLNVNATSSSDYELYKLATGVSGEYFLIENRAASGYDRGLTSLSGTTNFPGGLSILHIDDNIDTNSDENHKLVDVEEANNAGLDNQTDRGHINNLYFNGNADSFTNTTTPNSKRYNGTSSGISIENISDSAAVMTVDVNVN